MVTLLWSTGPCPPPGPGEISMGKPVIMVNLPRKLEVALFNMLISSQTLQGCDFSGTVIEIGSDVKSDVKEGDKIWGFVHGCNSSNPEDGAFAEYIVAKDGLFGNVPDFMRMEDAATLGVAVGANGQGLYQTLKLPFPDQPAEKPFPLLIYGGSTATGTIAIQLAKLSGLQVITTASPSNFELLKSRGADAMFDYNEPEVGENIRKFTDNNLKYVYDIISSAPSVAICTAAISTAPEPKAQYTALLPVEFPREDVDSGFTMAYTCWGNPFRRFGMQWPAKLEDYEFTVKFIKLVDGLITEGKIVPHPATVGTNGLHGILDA
ncbi:Protein TOXD [Lachnellula arida]|uniref:Protein TOXD n=1 Tax=Lachnellula arida TaxID=1316785 RepID=A0A8T9BCT4_9HELO|nr:Protein TOXD [Lachnellula arida]